MLAIFNDRKTPPISRARYSIKGFNGVDAHTPECVSNLEYCSYGYNFRLNMGVLTQGIGVAQPTYTIDGQSVSIKPLSTWTQRILKAHWFPHKGSGGEPKDELITYGNGYTLFAHPLYTPNGSHSTISVKHGTVPEIEFINYAINNQEKLLIYLGSGGLVVYDGTSSVSYDDVPGMSSVCMIYDRIFGVDYNDRSKIRFSALLSPHDFTESGGGGYISLMDDGGQIRKVVGFQNALYVFRDYAVNKISVYGSPSDYRVSKLISTGERIYGGTVATDGNSLVFIAGDKLYIYNADGLKVRFHGVTALVEDFTNAVSALSGGQYMLSAKLKTKGEKIADENSVTPLVRNGMISFSVYNDDVVDVFRGTDIAGFIPVFGDKLKAVFITFGNSRSDTYGMLTVDGCFMGTPLPKLWRSPTVNISDLGRVKRLRKMYVRSDGDIKITATMSGKSVIRAAYGRPQHSTVVFDDAIGEDLSLEIYSTLSTFRVEPPELVFDLNRRYT